MPDLFAYTDGACSGNPGPGGWGVLMIARENAEVVKTRELSGGEPLTTNNRMELMAAISALEALSRGTAITIVTDSSYVKNGVTEWIHGWKRNGWKTQAKQPVKNEDLWRQLDTAVSSHKIKWHWVKGHAGDAGNERCDELATAAITAVKQRHSKEQLAASLREFNASMKPAMTDLLPLG